jgi:hypothetical protein
MRTAVAAYWGSRIVLVAAQLGIADRLADGARTADDLAQELALHPKALYRFMRTLAGMGILTELGPHAGFALTPLGEALKADAPGAARSAIVTLVGEISSPGWDELRYALKTGKTGFEKVFGVQRFAYIAAHPEWASLFNQTMVGLHGAEPPAIASAYDFSQFASIVDLGGASGNLLAHILAGHAKPRGVVFDLPHVIRDTSSSIGRHGLRDRITLEAGNFFESVPAGHDAYILSHIIHDWPENECATILENCRQAIDDHGKLLIIEMVLPEGDTPHPGKMLDIAMLVQQGGQERTAEEYRDLLGQAGFRMTKVFPTGSNASIVEAVPV